MFFHIPPPLPPRRRPTARMSTTPTTELYAGVEQRPDPVPAPFVLTSHLQPPADPRYVTAPNDGRWKIIRSVHSSVPGTTERAMILYERKFGIPARTRVVAGVYQRGLFVDEAVKKGSTIME